MKNITKLFLIGTAIILTLMVIIQLPASGTSYKSIKNFNGQIKIYKSGDCGCCGVYSSYFRRNGNDNLKIINVQNTSKIMQDYGVPSFLESCHTTVIGKYFIEGHVPLRAIEKLLKEKPDIKGIGMSGMPSGSPGMTGLKKGDFIIYGINNKGSSFKFMRM